MNSREHDIGVFAATLYRFERIRLPRVLRLRDQVDAGRTLSSSDINYISESLQRTCYILPLIDRHPEYQAFAARIFQLYKHVVSVGLENEQSRYQSG